MISVETIIALCILFLVLTVLTLGHWRVGLLFLVVFVLLCGLARRSFVTTTFVVVEPAADSSIETVVVRSLVTVREKFSGSLKSVFPNPEEGFIEGLLLGGSAKLDKELREALLITGTTHLIALSGYNISIIVGVFVWLLSVAMIPRRWRFPVVVTALTLFVIMVGGGASVIRAAIMGSLVVLARHLGRMSSIRNVLVVTAALMLLHDPTLLTESLGFQLSFLATMAMIFVVPILETATSSWPRLWGAKEAILMTIAAEIFTLPLLMYTFGKLSIISPITNALVVPFIPYIMLVGFLGGLAGLVHTMLGQMVGFAGWFMAHVVLKSIIHTAALPFAQAQVSLPMASVTLYYIVLAVLLLRYYRKKRRVFTSYV